MFINALIISIVKKKFPYDTYLFPLQELRRELLLREEKLEKEKEDNAVCH